jgi:uncharacterized membrane protein
VQVVILSVQYIYWLGGALLLATAVVILCDQTHPRRFLAAAFWTDLGLLFIAGDKMPPVSVGAQVLALSTIAACGGLKRSTPKRLPASVRESTALRLQWRLLAPVLVVPLCTLAGSMLFSNVKVGGKYLLDPSNTNLAAFGIGCVIALILACWVTRDNVAQAVRQSREMTDAIAWTLVLPQMLSMLGAMFQHSGVGTASAYLVSHYVATDVRWVAVVVYCLGMAIFSMIMGGGAAAFPLMLSGIGAPVLIHYFRGNPAEVAALGFFAGYAGVLMTPMAAHFNLVPAALLELPDKYAVIRAQTPSAICILMAIMVLLYISM